MKNLLIWLTSIFKVDVVWVEIDHGQWIKRRRFHPAAKVIVIVCFLFLGVSLRQNFSYVFRVFSGPEPEAPVEIEAYNEIALPHETEEITQDEIADFPGLLPDLYPGPIPAELEVAEDEYWIRIIKDNFTLYLYRGLELKKSYLIAVGRNPGDKQRVGDHRTPQGIFTVQSIYDSRSWVFDFRDGNGPIRGAYGPWFIRLRTGWRGIGIHGTHDPSSLGTMSSEGCVRMNNYDLQELKQFVSINMTVVIEG